MNVAVRTAAAAVCVAVLFLAGGCSGKKKKNVSLIFSARERYEQGMAALERRKLREATTLLSRIDYDAVEERRTLEPLVRLGLADATFYQATDLAYIDARSLYLDFVTLFGDHPLAPYAQFQAGICSLQQVQNPSRDQTETLQAIADLGVAERRYPASPYAQPARLMRIEAESHLVRHELLVGQFYFKRKAYLAAADRFRGILERYPDYPDKETVYLRLGKALLASSNPAEARIYLDKLVTDYPDGRHAEEARKALDEAGGALEIGLDVP